MRRVNGQPRWYRVVRPLDPIALPDWLLTALTPPLASPRPPTLLPSSARRLDAYVHAALRGEATAVAHAVLGTRAHTLFRAAARLGELVGAGVLSETLAADALLAAAPISPSGADRFTPGEARRHIINGIARGRRNPRPVQFRIT